MNKNLAISSKDEKVPFPAAVRGSKTPVLKLSIMESGSPLLALWFEVSSWALSRELARETMKRDISRNQRLIRS